MPINFVKSRGHGGGGKGIIGGGGGSRAALSWGSTKRGISGHGYSALGGMTPYPSSVAIMEDIAMVAPGATVTAFLKRDGSLYTVGSNEDIGTIGNGQSIHNELVPQLVTGGVPLYQSIKGLTALKRPSKKWTQPVGPVGPIVPLFTAVATSNNDVVFALTLDGHVMGWGSGTQGVLSNGNENDQAGAPVLYEPEGIWPQWAPWWVQTGGPALVPEITAEVAAENDGIATISKATSDAIKAEAATKALTNIIAIAASDGKCAGFLDAAGEVWLSGDIAGRTKALYVERDAVWLAGKPTGPGKKAVAFAFARYGYIVLLEDKTICYVGVNHSGSWGNGSTVELGTDRKVTFPSLTNVIAIARSEYTCFAVKSDFSVWAWGGNEVGQLASGLSESEVWYTPKEIVSLRASALGGAHVVAIVAAGVKQGSGANNGDVAMVLLSDGTVRTWGSSWGFGDKASEAYVPWGTLGLNTTESVGRSDYRYQTPQQPHMPDGSPVANVVGIAAAVTHMVVIQEPGAPEPPVVTVNLVGKVATFTWAIPGDNPPAGKMGSLPLWLPPEGWQVNLINGPTKATGKELSAGTRSWTSPVLAAGEYEANISEKYKLEEPAITGGPVQKATGGKLTINWALPGRTVPGWVIAVQRTATFTDAKGVPGNLESGKRVPPEIDGALTTATITLPPPSAHDFGTQDLEQVTVSVVGTDRGVYDFTRKIRFVVP